MTTSLRLLQRGDMVVGLDNLNDYYDVSLKESRLSRLTTHENFQFVRADVADREAIERLFGEHGIDRVVHLAAQAGVRYSLENPRAYIDSNIVGFTNILEGCRHDWALSTLFMRRVPACTVATSRYLQTEHRERPRIDERSPHAIRRIIVVVEHLHARAAEDVAEDMVLRLVGEEIRAEYHHDPPSDWAVCAKKCTTFDWSLNGKAATKTL